MPFAIRMFLAALLGIGSMGAVAAAGEPPGDQQVTGEILKEKEVKAPGGQSHRVVMIDAGKGRRIVVDLGPSNRFEGPLTGQRLQAAGKVVRVGDRGVLMAERLSVAGRDLQVQRPQREKGAGPEATSRERVVSGVVGRQKEVQRPDGTGNNLVISLQPTEGGEPVIIDLGDARAISGMIREGDDLEATGSPVRVGDRLVLFADKIRAREQVAEVTRPGAGTPEPAGRVYFSELDENGDGQLTRQEASTHAPLAAQFEEIDEDNDRAISRAEFSAFMEATESGQTSKAAGEDSGGE